MTFDEFVSSVQEWQRSRGIYEHSTAEAQTLKAISELGELADSIIKNDRDALIDSIGDVAVCLVGVATMNDYGIYEPVANRLDDPRRLVVHLSSEMSDVFYEDCPSHAFSLLASLAKNSGLDFMECCESAWNEIKDRKGRMVVGGAFVKEDSV